MGYYVETDRPFGKADFIVKNYNGRIVPESVAKSLVDTEGVIVVLDNGIFEAAGFAYNAKEFEAFTSDSRPRTCVVINREKAKELTHYMG